MKGPEFIYPSFIYRLFLSPTESSLGSIKRALKIRLRWELSAIMLSVILLSAVMLSAVMLSAVMLSDIMLSAIMLSVIMLSAIMLSAIILSVVVQFLQCHHCLFHPTSFFSQLCIHPLKGGATYLLPTTLFLHAIRRKSFFKSLYYYIKLVLISRIGYNIILSISNHSLSKLDRFTIVIHFCFLSSYLQRSLLSLTSLKTSIYNLINCILHFQALAF